MKSSSEITAQVSKWGNPNEYTLFSLYTRDEGDMAIYRLQLILSLSLRTDTHERGGTRTVTDNSQSNAGNVPYSQS